MERFKLRFCVALLCIVHYALCIGAAEVKSPNGNIELKFSVDPAGRPVYEMSYKGKAVVKPSFLGLELAKDKHASKGLKETDLMDGFTIAKEETSTFDEVWKPVWGETATIRNHYVEYVAVLQQQSSHREMLIRFRVYNDGIGFRYEFPQQKELNYFLIKEERSEFAMAGATPFFFSSDTGALMFQFKRCCFAAADKACLPFLQKLQAGEYDRALAAMFFGTAAAYFKELCKDKSGGRERTDEERLKSAIESLDVFAYMNILKDNVEKLDASEMNSYTNSYKILDFSPATSLIRNAAQSVEAFQKAYTWQPLIRSDLNAVKTIAVPAYTFIGWSKYVNGLQKDVGKDMLISSFYEEGEFRKNVESLKRRESALEKEKHYKILKKPKKDPDLVYEGNLGSVVKRKNGQKHVGYMFVPKDGIDVPQEGEAGKKKKRGVLGGKRRNE